MLLKIISRFFYYDRNAELQIETLNIMAKYQVMFTKLETTVKKLCLIRRTRELLNLKTFFKKFRDNCLATPKEMLAMKALKKLKAAMLTMIRIHKRNRISLLRKYMLKFQLMAEAKKYAEVNEQRIRESSKQEDKDKEISSLNQWIKQKEKEVENLKKRQESVKKRLKQDRGMSNDSKKTRIASPRSFKHSKDHVKALKSRIRELERDNKVLREELEETEASVEDFIQEIYEIIESQDFARTFLLKL